MSSPIEEKFDEAQKAFSKSVDELKSFKDLFLKKHAIVKKISITKQWSKTKDTNQINEYLDLSLSFERKITDLLSLENLEDNIIAAMTGVERSELSSIQELGEFDQIRKILFDIKVKLTELSRVVESETHFLHSLTQVKMLDKNLPSKLSIFADKELELFNMIKKNYLIVFKLIRDYLKNKTQKMPLISVVIPAYNEEKWIGRCIESVLRQTYPNKEIIVVDNNSSDNTSRVASGYPCKLLKNLEPGVSKTKNLGAKAVRGDIIVFLDADSMMYKDVLEGIHHAFLEGYNCGKIIDIRSDREGLGSKFYRALWFIAGWVHKNGIIKSSGAGACTFSERKLFLDIGGFNPNMTTLEDEDMTRRLMKAGKFNFMSEHHIITSMRRFEKIGYAYALFQDFFSLFDRNMKREWVR